MTLSTGDDAVGLEAIIRGQAADLVVAGAATATAGGANGCWAE